MLVYPGRCPGLGASALSGRMGNSYCLRAYGDFLLPQGVWGIPIASGRMGNSYCRRAYGELFNLRLDISIGESRFNDVARLQF